MRLSLAIEIGGTECYLYGFILLLVGRQDQLHGEHPFTDVGVLVRARETGWLAKELLQAGRLVFQIDPVQGLCCQLGFQGLDLGRLGSRTA